MTQVKLAAEPRTEYGKGFSRRLRAAGRVPAVVYGSSEQTITLSLDAHELMLALKQPKVILEVTLEGQRHVVAPRDVQRHPFKPIIEHVDLVVLSRAEVRERLVLGQAMAKAEEMAIERELDPIAVQNIVSEILADEENDYEADQAIEMALTQVEETQRAQAEAAAALAAAEAAKAEEAEANAGDIAEAVTGEG